MFFPLTRELDKLQPNHNVTRAIEESGEFSATLANEHVGRPQYSLTVCVINKQAGKS
jgi:hypothetical protein